MISKLTEETNFLQGNLGWALMQQNNYIEAEDAYRRALAIAPDNNKMCNLGICLMKQGRVGEAKETLRRVKPAVVDGPRGVDSHLKAYERAQQMLQDLESEMMIKVVGSDNRLEQRKAFESFLGSSAIWQPQPCTTTTFPTANSHQEDQFPDENIVSSNNNNRAVLLPAQKTVKALSFSNPNSLNIDAPPFYSSKFAKEPLKRTRSAGNGTASNESRMPENKMRRQSISPEKGEEQEKWADLMLPDSKDFEDAIIAAALDSTKMESCPRKIDKRLKVFQDITLSLSPKA